MALCSNLSDDFGILCVMNEITEEQRGSIESVLNQLRGYTIEFDYCNNYFDELLFDDPFEDDDNFVMIKSFLDGITVKRKEYVR